MNTLLPQIEFGSGRIWLGAGGDTHAIERLNAVLSLSRARALGDVRLCHITGTSSLHHRAITTLAERYEATLTRRRPAAHELECDRMTSEVAADGTIVFSTTLANLTSAPHRVTTAMMVVGAVTNLDNRAVNQLRFCAYELAVNSAEHGNFGGRAPRIRMELRLHGDHATFEYRDNASTFVTDDTSHIDIDRKIADRDKRGLGLYILNRIGRSLEYRRDGDWNVTTLDTTVAYRTIPTTRGTQMEGISIDVKACALDATVVLKFAGSIDSSTAGEVESCVDGAIEQGNRFIVVDLSDVDFISSAGVGIFLGTVSILRSEGGDLIFMRVPRHVEEVFDIINLKSYFRTIGSLEELKKLQPR